MDSNMESPLELPFDSITEILSWLPVESLLRFKRVCRQWYTLIQDPYFIATHNRRATPVLLPYTLNNIDGTFYSPQSFAGLVLEKITSEKYQIRNPATRQALTLPDPHRNTLLMGAAFDSRTSECKLVAGYYVNWQPSTELIWEIFSVGRDEHWRPALKLGCSEDQEHRQPGMWLTAKSDWSLHCLRIQTVMEGVWDLEVVSFDIWTESYNSYNFPRGVFSYSTVGFLFFKWDKCVCVGDARDEELHVLVVRKHKDKYTWNDSRITIPLRFLEEIGYAINGRLVYVEATFDDLWLYYDDNVEVCCDMKTGRIKKRILCYGYEYRPSLVFLRGMRPEDQNQV